MQTVIRHRFVWALPALLLLGCTTDLQGGGPELAVKVAPLGLTDLSDAHYTVIVRAGDADGALVWAGSFTSNEDGRRGGALAAAVPCDATAGAHSVTLLLDALYDARGDLIAPERYRNPTPITVDAQCAEGTLSSVAFDMTVSRLQHAALLGESATFGGISCAARVSCEREIDGRDLDLLANPRVQGRPDMTAVLELACTRATDDATRLYLDDPIIRCDGLADDIVVDASGLGLVDLAAEPSRNVDGYLFAAAVNRDIQASADIAHWTVALGLDEATFATAGRCRLLGRASASVLELPMMRAGWELPPSAVYPVLAWDVELTDAVGRVCTLHEVSDDDGVEVRYAGFGGAESVFLSDTDPVCLRHRFAPTANAVSSALPY
ncbi:MAG: hypothetical protein EP329_10335 [Deltaproteobacteria bacterium]|nr:MAG: hypothetical protein EP329_10335 [Deltaproteobacteria bacterium]